MRIARLCDGENVIGSVSVAGKMPRAIVWLGSAYLRHGNSYKFRQVGTILADHLLRADHSPRNQVDKEKAREVAQRIRRSA